MHLHSSSLQAQEYFTWRDKYRDRCIDDADEVADDGVWLLGSQFDGVLDKEADGVGRRLGSFFNWRSNVWSCSMKWKLGDTSGLRARTKVKASLRPKPLANIRYASVIVTDCGWEIAWLLKCNENGKHSLNLLSKHPPSSALSTTRSLLSPPQ